MEVMITTPTTAVPPPRRGPPYMYVAEATSSLATDGVQNYTW